MAARITPAVCLALLLVVVLGLAEAKVVSPTIRSATLRLDSEDPGSFLEARAAGLYREQEVKEELTVFDQKWDGVIMPSIAAAATVIGALVLCWVPEEGPPPWMMAFALSLAAGFMVAVSVHMLTSSRGDNPLTYVDVLAFLAGAVMCGVLCQLSRRYMGNPEDEPKGEEAQESEESRIDPDDGQVGTLIEFRQKYDGCFDETQLVDFFQNRCQPTLKALDEKRTDPDDGRAYTLSEFRVKYAGVYDESELHEKFANECSKAPSQDGKPSRLGSIMFVTLCVHNIPEGAAVAIAASLTEPTLGIALMLAVALHNIPEGAALSVALYQETKDWWLSFNKTIFCGCMELFGAFLALLFIEANQGTPASLILTLTVVAGVMCYVAAFEILPEVVSTGEWLAIVTGFLLSFGCYMATMEVMRQYLDDGRTAVHIEGSGSLDRRFFI